jgi:hypothetical protein
MDTIYFPLNMIVSFLRLISTVLNNWFYYGTSLSILGTWLHKSQE